MSNNSNQSTKLLVLLVASLVGFSVITGNPLLVLSAFFVLAVVSTAVAFGLRILRFIAVSVYAALLVADAPKQPANTPNRNKRVAKAVQSNVVCKQSGERIGDVPAYIRKAQGYCYPLTKEVINKRTFTVAAASAN